MIHKFVARLKEARNHRLARSLGKDVSRLKRQLSSLEKRKQELRKYIQMGVARPEELFSGEDFLAASGMLAYEAASKSPSHQDQLESIQDRLHQCKGMLTAKESKLRNVAG